MVVNGAKSFVGKVREVKLLQAMRPRNFLSTRLMIHFAPKQPLRHSTARILLPTHFLEPHPSPNLDFNMTRTDKQVHDGMTEASFDQTIQSSGLDSMLALTMKDPTSSPSPVRRGASTKSSVWSTLCVFRSATVAMANISRSVELITSNSKEMHIASSTRELTTGSTAHLAISVATSQQEILAAVMYWTCHLAA